MKELDWNEAAEINEEIAMATGTVYERWANSPEGQAAIQAGMDKAAAEVEAYQKRREFEREQAWNKWCLASHNRMIDEELAKRCGAIDDDFVAEVPLDIGYLVTDEGIELCWVALGGHDVSDYLPPDVVADVRSHLQYKAEK